MNLFTLEQLTDSTRKTLLIWKQIKYIRVCKKKGRIPGWFSKLEQKVLKQNSNRELLDIYQLYSKNKKSIKVMPRKISQDRRKREWFLFLKDCEQHVGKIIRKTKKGIFAEHWRKTTTSEEDLRTFYKYKRCDKGKFNNGIYELNFKTRD